MKVKFLHSLAILLLFSLSAMVNPVETFGQTDTTETVIDTPAPTDEPTAPSGLAVLWAWIKANTAEAILALLAVMKIIVNLTPTQTDNRWYDIIEKFFNSIIPNLRSKSAGGGTHPA